MGALFSSAPWSLATPHTVTRPPPKGYGQAACDAQRLPVTLAPMPSHTTDPTTPTTQPRAWRVTAHPLVQATSPNEALDLAEQQLRDSGAKGTVRLDLISESTGETATRIVEL